jgi:hypothetical protein
MHVVRTPLDIRGQAPYGRKMIGNNLPAVRLSQHFVETANTQSERIRPLVRMTSTALTTHCRQAGLPIELAELCGGLLASVVDDLVAIGRLRKADFERTKRKQRILAATEEPARSALRLAVGASPINGRAAVAHWDAICDKWEVGKLAWLLGLDTETAYRYGRKQEQRA